MFKISQESQILDENIRKDFLKYIETSRAVKERMEEAVRRKEVYSDKTDKYVIERFKKENSDEGVAEEIKNRTSNISLARVIVDKKARVFGDGTRFEIAKKKEQKIVDELLKEMNIIGAFKKTNTLTELQKNTAFQCYPYKDQDGLYQIKTRVLEPYSYHVIVDEQDAEIALCYVLPSNIVDGKATEFIWWSNNYHMTTNSSGKIIAEKSPVGSVNEIGLLPIVQFSTDNTNTFWSDGGKDIIDGTILFNLLLTDTYYITKYQGMGIFYLFGKGIPKSIKVGPRDGVILEQKEGDPTPNIGFASSNPPIDSHMRLAEQCAMLILSSNEIDASAIAGSLASGAQSGFQEAIRKSEFVGDIEEKRNLYRDSIREVFKVLFAMIDLYRDRGVLAEKYSFLKGSKLSAMIPIVKFPKTQLYASEKEKLDVIEKRFALGLDDEIDSLIRDNNDLSREDAVDILKERKMRKLDSVLPGTEIYGEENEEITEE